MTQFIRNGFSKTCTAFVPHSFAQMAAAIFIPNYTAYSKETLQTISDIQPQKIQGYSK